MVWTDRTPGESWVPQPWTVSYELVGEWLVFVSAVVVAGLAAAGANADLAPETGAGLAAQIVLVGSEAADEQNLHGRQILLDDRLLRVE